MDTNRDIPENLVPDEIRLRQVLVNLLGNAIKFTSTGFIKIDLDCHISADEKNKVDLICSVTDTGLGIPDEKLKQISEAFTQVKSDSISPQPGTGLGLSISSRLVEIMGGKMTISSSLGRGSVFNVE